MAKTTGPLMSLDASGSFGGTLVFSKWKGRGYVRQLVTPANPHAAGQETARNSIRTAGSAQKWANGNTQVHASNTLNDKLELIAVTPAGQAWNGFLVDSMIGAGNINMSTSDTQWAALTAPQKSAWDTAASGLTFPLLGVPQTIAGGGAGTAKSNGQVFYNYIYGLFVAGIVPAPTATPPVYT